MYDTFFLDLFFIFSWLPGTFCNVEVMRNKELTWNSLNDILTLISLPFPKRLIPITSSSIQETSRHVFWSFQCFFEVAKLQNTSKNVNHCQRFLLCDVTEVDRCARCSCTFGAKYRGDISRKSFVENIFRHTSQTVMAAKTCSFLFCRRISLNLRVLRLSQSPKLFLKGEINIRVTQESITVPSFGKK